ncbi:dihydrolipoamide acetyltransferase family protein [Dactylosporangium sp. CS-033363]|uniref:dihydrolipoamide acetyltransferase family protein n=1 Tax=Dactylosporangium sp. CS-033363 TaxID=3239935 RepID=UPI003D8FD418
MPDFLLPDLGEGLTEAEVLSWMVRVGDTVRIDQPVVEVETAKASVEVPVPFAGTVSALHATPGTVVRVGAPLITVTPVEAFQEPGIVTPVLAPAEEGSGAVLIGYGTTTETRRRRGARRTANVQHRGPVRVISPFVRRMAREAGLDLNSVVGTGPEGLIRRADVEQALATAPSAETRRPLRRAMAEKLSRSRREIPEATVWVDVDATEFLAARTVLNAQSPVSLLGLLSRFVLLGLARHPELNARVEGAELVIPSHVNLGFAAQTDHGLVVPVVRDAHLLPTRALSAAIAAHTQAARSNTLSPADLTGGTFTVNNYGVFGVDGSAAIINHPEVAILGIGRIMDRPWVVDGQLTVRKVTQLTLAFDHRACDGGTAGGFLRYVANCVESPLTALGDL